MILIGPMELIDGIMSKCLLIKHYTYHEYITFFFSLKNINFNYII